MKTTKQHFFCCKHSRKSAKALKRISTCSIHFITQQAGAIYTFFILLLITIPLFFGSTAYSQGTALKDQFRLELDAVHKKYKFPGATAAFILPNGKAEVVSVGLADIESRSPMLPESRMLAASIGKTFVGATILALVLQDSLDLDKPISAWLGDKPWFSRLPNSNDITLYQLLTHTSGIPNHVESEKFALDFKKGKFSTDALIPPESLIEYVLDQPALFKPGKAWHYSDTGYLIVGFIIESLTGRSLYVEIEQLFLAPLHLNLTTPSNRRNLPGLAAGYIDTSNIFGLPAKTIIKPGIMAWNPAVEWAGGGFVSNSKDLVIWGKNLYEGNAMEGDYLDLLLHAVKVDENMPGVEYGIAIGIHRQGSFGPSYGHGGWIPGYVSSLRYYPKYKIAVAFQINTDIGIVDDSTPIVEEMEQRLSQIIISALNENSKQK